MLLRFIPNHQKNYETIKKSYNHTDENSSIDLLQLNGHKTSNDRRYSYILVVIYTFSEYCWTIPLKTKNSRTISDELSKFVTTSKRKRFKIESDREE